MKYLFLIFLLPVSQLAAQQLNLMPYPEGFNKKTHKPRTSKMNEMFAFVAYLSGASENRETRLSEITLRKSGLAGYRELEAC